MKVRRQRLELQLHRHTLHVWRLDEKGEHTGEVTVWKIGANKRKESSLPRVLFFLIWSYVLRRVKPSDDKSFPVLKKMILSSLCEAAEASGCTHEFGKERGDITWYLDKRPFVAFQIHNLRIRRFQFRQLLRSRAVARYAFKVTIGGFVRYKAGKVRRKQ